MCGICMWNVSLLIHNVQSQELMQMKQAGLKKTNKKTSEEQQEH